jgi:hypothetical protein
MGATAEADQFSGFSQFPQGAQHVTLTAEIEEAAPEKRAVTAPDETGPDALAAGL